MVNRERLLELWARPEMEGMAVFLRSQCPPIPEWLPGKTLEQWAEGTALRQGYLLCLSNLGLKDE